MINRISPTLLVEVHIASAKRQLADLLRIRDRLIASRFASWADCPKCRQSATGVYSGRAGCFRCGWVA